MHAEQTAPAPSDVLARSRRATMTGTMTGHDNGQPTQLQQQIHGNPQSVPHSLHNERRLWCDVCFFFFAREEDLQSHQKTEHLMRCRACYQIYHTNYDLREHECMVEPFECDLCWENFTTESNLALHRESAHQVALSMCLSCGCIFSTEKLLNVRFAPIHSGNA